ncbi:MAG: CopG family transcriptional regulator [Rhodothermia bacterium]|nr:CopG family transcriptional regulator [Rhodothermia bacterium]
MSTKSKRATIYFDAELHRALRLKAAETDQSMSDVVNEAVRILLLEDAQDLKAARERQDERTVSFESFVADLKKHGRL